MLGQADHGRPVRESFAYTHPRKLDEMRETWPGIVHGQQRHRSPHLLSPQLSYVESWSGGQLGTKPGVIKRTKYSETGNLNLEHCCSTCV